MKYIDFEWYTKFYPSKEQIAAEQEKRGYHPAGYGDPFSIQIKASDREGSNWKTVWSCYGSCD